jgi:hypothetical protein
MWKKKKEEQLETPQTKHQDKGKQVINDTSSYDPILEIPYVPKAPYPERLKASSHFGKQEKKIQDMMETFKQIKVNIPLLDAIKQVPAYAKFLKDLCTQKRKNRKHIPKKVCSHRASELPDSAQHFAQIQGPWNTYNFMRHWKY